MKLWKGSQWGFVIVILGCLVTSGCATGGSFESGDLSGTRIGVVDPQRVLNETDAGRQAKETLENYAKNRQAIVQLEEKELKRMEEDLLKQSSVLSANAKKTREERFRRKMVEYQQKVGELNREVQMKQKEVFDGFRGKVEEAVAKVAQEKGVLVVIEKGAGGPTLYNDVSLDLSTAVIREMNKSAR
ncbi:MAG: OmpH family outer membrane protein [Nitrospiraceae bacterium]